MKKPIKYLVKADRDVLVVYRNDGTGNWGQTIYDGELISMEIEAAYSCCGFPELAGININASTWKKLKPLLPQIIKETRRQWAKNKVTFIAAYVPDLKTWKWTRAFLGALGFKRTISVPSYSGRQRYTNTRYEWYTPGVDMSNYIKEDKFEGDVPALNV